MPSFAQVLERLSGRPERPLSNHLLEILTAGHRELDLHPAQKSNLAQLAHPQTVYVITGQQLGLALGPLLTLYKALSAIKLAGEISKQSSFQAVPIFWLQAEDHDLDEIATISHYSSAGLAETNRLKHAQYLTHQSVEYYALEQEVLELFAKLQTTFVSNDDELRRFQTITKQYQPGRSLSTAFLRSFSDLLGRFGLLFINPRWPGVAHLAKSVYQTALNDFEGISARLQLQSAELESQKEEVQVKVRPDSPLFFIHLDSPSGQRFRLQFRDGLFRAIGANVQFTKDQLVKLLDEAPERVSSSALLRPVVQETLFPACIYIGGEAEVRYFQQVEAIYSNFALSKPHILPRASFLLLEPRTRRLLEQAKLKVTDVLKPQDQLLETLRLTILPAQLQPEELFPALSANLDAALNPVRDAFQSLEAGSSGLVDRTAEKIKRAIDGLSERYSQLVERRLDTDISRAKKLHALLYPNDLPQERGYSLLPFWCKYGTELIDRLHDELDPMQPETRIIEL